MQDILVALTAFVDAHQLCGELDGGRPPKRSAVSDTGFASEPEHMLIATFHDA
jgi:hypothetical protein